MNKVLLLSLLLMDTLIVFGSEKQGVHCLAKGSKELRERWEKNLEQNPESSQSTRIITLRNLQSSSIEASLARKKERMSQREEERESKARAQQVSTPPQIRRGKLQIHNNMGSSFSWWNNKSSTRK